MNKFEATVTARENGWDGWGHSLFHDDFCATVPTGNLRVHLDIGYELSNDNLSDDEASLVLEHYKPSTAHPPVCSRKCYLRYMTETSFYNWVTTTAKELIEFGQEKSIEGTLP